ncbi:MAG: hypothetical protein FJX76_20320, partial [Armatimonadetes bacterium]|nr:hypothetical protein [Armatimonadota bacterium]
MKSTLAVLMVVFGMLAGPALGQAETWTLNPKGGDGIEIIKVTPRLNAGIPVPSRFRYRMEVKVRIRSAPA